MFNFDIPRYEKVSATQLPYTQIESRTRYKPGLYQYFLYWLAVAGTYAYLFP